jgi:AcrR family transcriptional regulator
MRSPRPDTSAGLARYKQLAKQKTDATVRQLADEAGVSYRSVYRYLGPSGRHHGYQGPKFTQETALAAFKDACEQHFGGQRPTSQQYQELRGAPVSFQTLWRLFGSWDAVLKAAGFTPIEWRTRGLPAKMRLTSADMEGIIAAKEVS